MERGVFGLGNQMIDAAAENWIKCGRGNAECDKIVISGPCENAIVVLGRLLELGISPGRLVWLAPLSGDSLIELGHGDVSLIYSSCDFS